MMQHRTALASALLAALIQPTGSPASAAGAQPEAVAGFLALQAEDQRIADVSWRLASANANLALCPRHMNSIGISVHDAAQYAPRYRKVAMASFGFSDGYPAILAVAKGAPADHAGLLVGDRIVAIDGVAVPTAVVPARARESYKAIEAVMTRLESLPADRAINFDLLRGQTRTSVRVRPVTTCLGRVEVVPGDKINAGSNGLVVQIYGKLASWARNDDELAIVIAHEMAHNILDHNARIEREGIGTGILASLGSDGRKMRDMEREADRYGLYLVKGAGYDYTLAGAFWGRLSGTSGLGAIWATTHPTAVDRKRFNDEVIASIQRDVPLREEGNNR